MEAEEVSLYSAVAFRQSMITRPSCLTENSAIPPGRMYPARPHNFKTENSDFKQKETVKKLVKFYTRLKYGSLFILLMLIDIGPIPVTAMLALYVILFRPRWFKKLVDDIY